MQKQSYLFSSARLGFRNWLPEDLEAMAAINADPAVMQFFPATQTREDTAAFMDRMQQEYAAKGFCYFAVEVLENEEFIGFIGLCTQDFEASFTPCTDIGWRLKTTAWHKGYATEGAARCLEYAFGECGLKKLYAMAPVVNGPSINVMQKIGMHEVQHFIHPKLRDNERLQECVLYEITPR
jgi:RimJ/RimL family protein N-acetyltransferase